jgi:hypothetical protein
MKMGFLLAAAVAVGAAVALVGPWVIDRAGPAPRAAPGPPPAPLPRSAPHEADPAGEILQGDVLEAIDVPNYTYLRLASHGSEVWAAVATASVRAGTPVRILVSAKMVDFQSSTLGRTFPEIFFGVIDGGGERPPSPHGATAAGAEVKIGRVAKAEGPAGRTVAEAIADRRTLSGKTVRVRAIVVKVTPGVLGRTYVHVRDGSGSVDAGTADLTVTMQDTPTVGQQVLVEGTLSADRDFGAGYHYDAILEEARLVSP